MMLKNSTKKILTTWFILILFISLIFSSTISADFKPDDPNNPDGVAYDTFDNDDDITLTDCVLDKESITLVQKEFIKTFDRDETPDNFEAWRIASIGVDIIFSESSVFGTLDLLTIILITLISFCVGYLSIELLLKVSQKIDFGYFCIVYGIISYAIIIPFLIISIMN